MGNVFSISKKDSKALWLSTLNNEKDLTLINAIEKSGIWYLSRQTGFSVEYYIYKKSGLLISMWFQFSVETYIKLKSLSRNFISDSDKIIYIIDSENFENSINNFVEFFKLISETWNYKTLFILFNDISKDIRSFNLQIASKKIKDLELKINYNIVELDINNLQNLENGLDWISNNDT